MNNDDDSELYNLLEKLGFCGCGSPNDALKLIHDLIQYLEQFRDYKGPYHGIEWEEYCKEDKDSLKKVIDENYDGICYTLFYFLDSKEITSHGGSVPGWLEDHDFYEKLKRYLNRINSE
jgi:hypothetical protein